MSHPFVPYSLNLRGRLIMIEQPLVMGIVNITDDSFYAGSRVLDEDALTQRLSQMFVDGADIIDIGACSTRPGSHAVDEGEELQRLEIALRIAHQVVPQAMLSVDTYRAQVARTCVEQWGADIVNDISGGTLDDAMFDTIATLHCPYVLTHMRGTPATMQGFTNYNDVSADVLEWLARKLDELRCRGVSDVLIDPGFGFAKTTAQNYDLLRHLEAFHSLDAPLLVGMSRKRMVCEPLGITADQALNGTTVVNTVALLAGAQVLRVHDVSAACEARTLVGQLLGCMPSKKDTVSKEV